MAFQKKPVQAFETEARPPIELIPVKSRQVAAIGYDPEARALHVMFLSKGAYAVPIYVYPDVSPETHTEFVGAESIGTYFGAHIKALPFKKYPAEPATEA